METTQHALEQGINWIDVAVAWALRHRAVDGAIVGFRRPDQVDPLLAAANLELTDEDVAEIEAR